MKTDEELMEQIQMLMAQVSEAATELAERDIRHNIIVYGTGNVSVSFRRVLDITPGKPKS